MITCIIMYPTHSLFIYKSLWFQIYAIRNIMQNIPPNPEKKRANGRSDSESNRRTEDWKKRNGKEAEEGKKKNMEQKRKLLLQTKFIKDPERRLYYYVERK